MNQGIQDFTGDKINVQSIGQKNEKDYLYIPMLLAKIFKMRKNDSGCMQDYMEMSLNDPQLIAPTIAPINPFPTSELVANHRSRRLDFRHSLGSSFPPQE